MCIRDRVFAEHPGAYRMVQRNKKFEPNLLVVPLDSVVDFPNLDPWFHNVFSLYRGKRFDLGLYEAGKIKQVRFDHLGASYIFCNIHPEMTAVVLTIDSDNSAVSGKNGDFAIANVSPGGYQLHVWYENANSKDLAVLERPVVIDEGLNHLPPVVIPVINASIGHKNKSVSYTHLDVYKRQPLKIAAAGPTMTPCPRRHLRGVMWQWLL